MPYRVELTYFKESGKYYSSGQYVSQMQWMHEIFVEVRELSEKKRLPGLVEGHSPFFILVEVPGHQHEHPVLIVPEEFRRI